MKVVPKFWKLNVEWCKDVISLFCVYFVNKKYASYITLNRKNLYAFFSQFCNKKYMRIRINEDYLWIVYDIRFDYLDKKKILFVEMSAGLKMGKHKKRSRGVSFKKLCSCVVHGADDLCDDNKPYSRTEKLSPPGVSNSCPPYIWISNVHFN